MNIFAVCEKQNVQVEEGLKGWVNDKEELRVDDAP